MASGVEFLEHAVPLLHAADPLDTHVGEPADVWAAMKRRTSALISCSSGVSATNPPRGAASVPYGLVDGLLVGLQIVGPPGSDARILRLDQAFTEHFPQNAYPPAFA